MDGIQNTHLIMSSLQTPSLQKVYKVNKIILKNHMNFKKVRMYLAILLIIATKGFAILLA